MKEILKDMWGGLSNVTAYRHVVVIAMFLLFLYFVAVKVTGNEFGVTEVQKWLEKEGNRKSIESDLTKYNYLKKEELKRQGYFTANDINTRELVNMLNDQGYYKFDDSKIVDALEKHIKSLKPEAREEYYSNKTGLVYKLRDLEREGKVPFNNLNNFLKATVPDSKDRPNKLIVHVSPHLEDIEGGKIVTLTGTETGKKLTVFAKPVLGESSDSDQIHLHPSQARTLLNSDRAYKHDVKFAIEKDDFCSNSSHHEEGKKSRIEQLCKTI